MYRAVAELSFSEQAYARDPTPALAASLKMQTRVMDQQDAGKQQSEVSGNAVDWTALSQGSKAV